MWTHLQAEQQADSGASEMGGYGNQIASDMVGSFQQAKAQKKNRQEQMQDEERNNKLQVYANLHNQGRIGTAELGHAIEDIYHDAEPEKKMNIFRRLLNRQKATKQHDEYLQGKQKRATEEQGILSGAKTPGQVESEQTATTEKTVRDILDNPNLTTEQKRILASLYGAKVPTSSSTQHMHPVSVSDPNDPTKTIPAMQSTVPDEEGRYPVFGTDGKIIANPEKLLPGMLPTEHIGEMPVFNPATNQIEQQPTYSKTKKIAPAPKADSVNPSAKGTSSPAKGKTTPEPGSGGRHGIPMRQFMPLQKQATAISEARNSLIGDDPAKPGGLYADLEVFKNPESVRRLGEYIGIAAQVMDNQSKQAVSAGPLAAVEWYANIPQALVGLQQGALRDASTSLDGGAPDGPEHKFVADYFRALGTIGGLRAATGASAAQWSFNTLRSELPTPGPVTSYPEAQRRIQNFVNETNVVSQRNPLSKPVDTAQFGGKKKWSKKKWGAANPGKDVNAAAKAAKDSGKYEVVD